MISLWRGKVCTWEGGDISSPFPPLLSILNPTPAPTSHCQVLLSSCLSGWCGTNLLSITFSGRTSPSDFPEDSLLQSSLGGCPLLLWDGTPCPKFHCTGDCHPSQKALICPKKSRELWQGWSRSWQTFSCEEGLAGALRLEMNGRGMIKVY